MSWRTVHRRGRRRVQVQSSAEPSSVEASSDDGGWMIVIWILVAIFAIYVVVEWWPWMLAAYTAYILFGKQ